MQCNAYLTIYNMYVDAPTRSEKWQRTQVLSPVTGRYSVVWNNMKGSNVNRSGRVDSNQATIYIPLTSGANYVKPRTWQALSVKTGFFTLQQGAIVVSGLVTDELTDVFTAVDLRAKYDDVLEIKQVDWQGQGSSALQHWEVGAQ